MYQIQTNQQEMADRLLVKELIEEVISFCVEEKVNEVKCYQLGALDMSLHCLSDSRVQCSNKHKALLRKRAVTVGNALTGEIVSIEGKNPVKFYNYREQILKLKAVIDWAKPDSYSLVLFEDIKREKVLN